MATEADLIQKFKDLNIPVGADFEELIHEAFVGANLADKVENHDSRIATVEDNLNATKGSIQANTNQLATKADDSKVAHLSGSNNFDTVPTVNNNPLLLASSLPSDLARMGSDQEFTGKNTFDTAPIDRATGNPYITKDGVPAVPSTLADTTKDANFTGKLQKSGIDVATKPDVTTAVSTATANMVDSTKATNFTAGLQSGGVDVATAADLKSVKDSAWRQLDNKYIKVNEGSLNAGTYVLYRLDTLNKRLLFMFTINSGLAHTTVTVDFSSVVSNICTPILSSFSNYFTEGNNLYGGDTTTGVEVSGNLLNIRLFEFIYASSMYSSYRENGITKYNFCFVTYDKLV